MEERISGIGLVYLYVWNYTATNWSQLDSGSGITDFNLTARLYNLSEVRREDGDVVFLVQD